MSDAGKSVVDAIIRLRVAIHGLSEGRDPREGQWIVLQLPDPYYSMLMISMPVEYMNQDPQAPIKIANIVVTRFVDR